MGHQSLHPPPKPQPSGYSGGHFGAQYSFCKARDGPSSAQLLYWAPTSISSLPSASCHRHLSDFSQTWRGLGADPQQLQWSVGKHCSASPSSFHTPAPSQQGAINACALHHCPPSWPPQSFPLTQPFNPSSCVVFSHPFSSPSL